MLLHPNSARNHACITWLEELERLGLTYYDFLGFVEGLNMPAAVSPLHDRDKYTPEDVRKWLKRHEEDVYDPDTGEIAPEWVDKVPKVGDPKKPHIHVMLRHSGNRSAAYSSKLFAQIGLEMNVYRWEKVEHVESMLRYFAHLDQPDKAEYSAFDVVGFGGIDLSCLVKSDNNSKLKVLCELQTYVDDNKVQSYHVLCRHAFATRDLDYINCVTGRASYWTGYFGSMRQDRMDRAAKEKEQAKGKK